MKKICKRCGIEKEIDEFRKRLGICKKCENEKYLEYYHLTKEKRKDAIKERLKKYRSSEKYKKKRKEYKEKNI